jgi:hypothetical protein
MPKIDHGVVESVSVPVPPIADGIQIVSAMRRLNDHLALATQKLASSRLLFSTTLNLLMTGQVRVPIPPEAA